MNKQQQSQVMQAALEGKPTFIQLEQADVPCGTCTECCKGVAVYLYPEQGDDPTRYVTEEIGGRLALAHQGDDCFYLGPDGCTIYDYRPMACRAMDCRKFLPSPFALRMQEAARKLPKGQHDER